MRALRELIVAIILMISMCPTLASDAIFAEGREKSELFLRGELADIWRGMTPDVQQLFGTLEGFQDFRDRVVQDFGAETEVLSEEVQPGEGVQTYVRTSKWTLSGADITMQWAITGGEQVVGLSIQPVPQLAESRFLTYQTKTPLRLPFSGEWFVVWGGRTLERNYHAADRRQRFALDMLIFRREVSHEGDPAVLDNYFCWDQPIVAPAAGRVTTVVDGLPDNAIGSTDADNPAGNHVVLDFENGEFGFLGHMRQNSIKTAVGDAVMAGQELGRCGNSGNTSEPHLHFHLQTSPDLTGGEGLPAFFNDYVADDQPVKRGEPLAGQFVQPE